MPGAHSALPRRSRPVIATAYGWHCVRLADDWGPMIAIRTRPERLWIGTLLAAVGGFLDAYTYVGHGGVFANAQTGNVVLLAIDAAENHWGHVWVHVPPVLAFVVGVLFAETLARPAARKLLRRPTRVVLGAEILVLVLVACLPSGIPSLVVTVAIAFLAALQVSTFRLLGDTQYNTTMVTGNLRTLAALSYLWFESRDGKAGKRALSLAVVIVGFVVGAAGGAVLTNSIGKWAALVPAAVLTITLVGLIAETRAQEAKSLQSEH